MEIKKLITPFVLAGLFAGFALICLMVMITKGRNAKWIARKMKAGAAIIAITTVSTGCPPMVTCYDMPAVNQFQFDQLDEVNYMIVADLPGDSILSGTLYEKTEEQYGFEVFDADSNIIDKGSVAATDGKFDSSVEQFTIKLNPEMQEGLYRLSISASEPAENMKYTVGEYDLKIK